MGRLRASLAASFAVTVFAVHAVLLPPLYLSLAAAVRHSYETQFVANVRAFARIVADQVEIGHVADSPRLVRDILDSVILSGDGIYADLRTGTTTVRSELSRPGMNFPVQDDFSFGAHGDQVYFLSMQIPRDGAASVLRLGFDERPTLVRIREGVRRVIWTLAAYMAFSLVLASLLGWLLARPVNRLQRAARSVAGGQYELDLRLATRVLELHELSQDLERMRASLLSGLRERSQLEQRLQHRHRLETVGTLAGGIAHEFNNILVPITLLTEATLRQLPRGGARSADLEAVLAAAGRARDLVRQILTFSREINAGSLVWSDPAAVVREALRLFEPLVSPNVRIEVALAADCPRVRLDRTLAVQLVLNLLTNGYQALAGASGRLRVGLRVVDGAAVAEPATLARHYVELSVADSGHGMDAETLEHIFEPFFTTRGVGEGTGLGLSVVHGIAESFAASIEVSSVVGSGSTFRVYFPCEERLEAVTEH